MDDEKCYSTGMDTSECPCMWCLPPMFFFKFMLVDYQIETIDDVITALNDRLDFFKKLKEDGFILMGPIDDHYAEFEPPESDDYYWVQCRSGGCYLKINKGELPPQECPECGKNVYKHEK